MKKYKKYIGVRSVGISVLLILSIIIVSFCIRPVIIDVSSRYTDYGSQGLSYYARYDVDRNVVYSNDSMDIYLERFIFDLSRDSDYHYRLMWVFRGNENMNIPRLVLFECPIVGEDNHRIDTFITDPIGIEPMYPYDEENIPGIVAFQIYKVSGDAMDIIETSECIVNDKIIPLVIGG